MKIKPNNELRMAGWSYEGISKYHRRIDKAIDAESHNMLAVLESLLDGESVRGADRDKVWEIIFRIQETIDKAGEKEV